MKFTIKNLGPLKDAELELGDITVLLGPPNSGKSYTLKSLYAQLITLDQTARDFILREVIDNLEVWEHINYFVRTLTPKTLIAIIAFHDYIMSKKSKEIINYLKNKTGMEQIDVKIVDENLVITLGATETIDITNLTLLFEEKFNLFLQRMLPTTENTEIAIPEVFIPEMLSLLLEIFNTSFRHEMGIISPKEDIRSILRVFLKLENDKVIKITIYIETHIGLEGPLWTDIKEQIREIFKDEDIYKLLYKLLEEIFEHKLPRTHFIRFLEWDIGGTFRYLLRDTLSKLKKHLVERIGEILKSAYEGPFNVKSALFIPFGRSPFVYQLDTVSNEPYLWDNLTEIYKDNLPFYSYIHHLVKGRSQLLRNEFDEKLVKMFNPVLQGELVFDKTTKKLRYRKWDSPDVPINHASALAGEIAGILLPLLNISPNSYLIIEEPEAQLHYSAQILMALTLAGLSSEFNHKIVFSTHSDVLAITLAYLKGLEYDKKDVVKLIQKYLKHRKLK